MDYQPDRTFDVIYSSLTFMHIRNKKKAIEKVRSMLSENGRFVLSIDKNQDAAIVYGTREVDVYPDQKDTISAYLTRFGMTILKQYEMDFAHILVACIV